VKAIQMEARALMAPVNLGLDTRVEFRRAAVQALETMPEGDGPLVIELAGTRTVDSAGLGVLMLVQRHASERRVPVVLRNANDELRFLLTLTKLVDLFQLEPTS
jgi:anti-anti-sigma factor